MRTRLLGTTSHITIFPRMTEYISNYEDVVKEIETLPDVVAASPFIYYKAAIQSASLGDGIIVRGIDLAQEARTASIEKNIVAGKYSFDINPPDSGEKAAGIILGSSLADRLGVGIGDPVVLYSLSGEDLRGTTRPRVAKFYVSGIFESGMYEFDAEMAYIPLTVAQDLFKTGHTVTGVHLKLTDIYLAEKVAPELQQLLGYDYDVVPWYVLHKNLFSWIALEKKILFIGFILIVLVAAFSIISTLVMLAMEKRSEIGILKAIGVTPPSVRKIFVYNGLIIGSVGIIGGWAIAIFAAWLQNTYNIISLPPDLYFISYLPIKIQPFDFVLAGLVTIFICFLAALYPAYRAASQSVIDVIRQ